MMNKPLVLSAFKFFRHPYKYLGQYPIIVTINKKPSWIIDRYMRTETTKHRDESLTMETIDSKDSTADKKVEEHFEFKPYTKEFQTSRGSRRK